MLYLWRVTVAICLSLSALGNNGLCSPSSSPSRTSSPSAVGLRGYRRFHANDSLIGQPIPCTHEEKLCFRYNLYFDSSRRACHGRFLYGDREKFWHTSGRLTPIEGTESDRCYDDGGIRLAYDSNCYQKNIVHDIICGCHQTTFHILGGEECRCISATPIHVDQPEKEGECRIPNMRFSDNRTHLLRNSFEDIQGFKIENYFFKRSETVPRFTCSSEQAQCFSEGKVWVAEGQGCFPLLEKGPCAEEHVVALDAQAAREGHAEATCVHVRGGCPDGHVRMAFDEQCHSEYDLSIFLPYRKISNQFGVFLANTCGLHLTYIPTWESGLDSSNVCSVELRTQTGGCGALAFIPCISKDGCSKYEVISQPPKPMEE